MPRFLRLLLPLFALAACLRAQSVRWDPASGTLARDQVSQLALVFEDAEPKDPPVPPKVDGLTFGNPGRSEQSSFNLSIGSGSQAVRRRTIIYTFPVRPTRSDGEVRIPAFAVETDAGRLTVPAAGFQLAAATVGQSGPPLEQIATARFETPAAPIWAGEVFRLGFQLQVDRRYATNNILGGALDWNPAPLVTEEWSKPAGTESTGPDGRPRLIVSMETRAIAPVSTTAALLPLPAATQVLNLPTGQANPFSLFGQTTFEQYTLTTAPARLAVNPLPSPAPADFIGAVGQFTLASKIVPEKAAVGEPVTWTLTMEGTGNWPAIDKLRPRSLARDFRVVNPRAQKTAKPDSLFDGSLTEDLVLIPQKAGRFTLGPYTVSIFNPATGAYETLRAEPVTIEIAAPATSPASATAAAAPSTPSESGPAAETSSLPPPPPPAAAPGPVATLPADPLQPGLVATAPRPDWPRALFWALAGLVAPLALWLVLSARHARTHDPLRHRRAAHEELRRILARLETERPAAALSTASELLAWQHTVRTLLALPASAPSARDLPDPVWAALWAETERALYRPSTPLAKEWFAQAWQAHAAATPPRRSPLAALRPAHLFARSAAAIATLLAVAAFSPSTFAAEAAAPDATALYARGDFPAAEAALRPAVAATPLDAALRHNLALSLAQQGKWDEATAHAYAAALQRPGDLALERLFASIAPRAGYRVVLPPAPARLLPLARWQTLGLASAFALLALAPAAWLIGLHGGGRGIVRAGHATFLLGTLTLGASWLAVRAHGASASPDAVLVWRAATLRAVPTDAGEQKVTAELPAGTIARVDKAFLGWRRVVLADGNSGWVRAEPLVALWR